MSDRNREGAGVVDDLPQFIIHTDKDHPIEPTEQKIFADLGARLVFIQTNAEFLSAAKSAVAVLNSGFKLTAELIQSLDRCRVISRYGSGVDNIDVAAATRKGIAVASVPVFCVEEVANRALTLLLACGCDLVQLDNSARNAVWGVQNLAYGAQIEGSTLGLVGYGKIARAVALRAKPFGFRVIAYDPFVFPELASRDGVALCGLEQLLAESDYVSVHTPLTPQTYHLLDARKLGLMKPTAILVNTSRGAVIDEAALVDVLTSRRIAGAGLDVFENEPPDKYNPLFALENVILTPHCAAHTDLATRKVRQGAVEAVIRALKGQWPLHLVNPEVREMEQAVLCHVS